MNFGTPSGVPFFVYFKKYPEYSGTCYEIYNYFLLVIFPPPRTMFTRARRTANIRAVKNPSTWKPGTILVTSRTISMLINKENRPSVSIFIGRVRILSITHIVLLTIARTTATVIAMKYPSTEAPGVIYAAIATAIPDIKRLIRIFIV